MQAEHERTTARVLVFALAYPPMAVGSGLYAHRLATGLTGAGHQVCVLAPADAAGEWAAFDAAQPHPTRRFALPRFVLSRYAVARRQLRQAIAEFQPEVVWTTNGMATRVVGSMAALDGRRPRLVSCMRGSDLTTRLPGRTPWAWIESVWQRRCYARSAAIGAACEYLKRLAVRKGIAAGKIFFHPSAFDFGSLDAYRYDPARVGAAQRGWEGRRVVLTVARLVRQKRVHVLLAAMALLAARLPDALLVVVGDGPERAALAQRAAALGSGARVEFVGRVPPLSTALYDLYSRAQVVAMAGVREGLSNVLMEAGALGRPGVGADDGGTPEVIRDGRTGLLARRDDPADFARCLEELLRDPARAEAMGRDARAWIRAQFGLPALVERANAALRRVLAARDVA